MKAQLVVVQGKPEGKVIPLSGPTFKIGRGESCHLRPNSERISREHAEFQLTADDLRIRDLGSRNGTLVNGKAVPLGTVCRLNDRDLVQIGPLTFAVAILSEPKAAAPATVAPAAPPKAKISPDDISSEDIDSWLVGAGGGSTADLPTTVYGGETKTIAAFPGKANPAPPLAPVPAPAPAQPSVAKVEIPGQDEDESSGDEQDHESVDELHAETYDRFDDDDDEEVAEDVDSEEQLEDFVDESNPFHAAKKAAQVATPVKAAQQDTSDVAHDILRKLMQQRKASKL
jgi:predicted component of type VI protein secretion system